MVVFEPRGLPVHGRPTTPASTRTATATDNADEIDNGTNPCSSADLPPDADADLTSDLNDPDDDNDGLPDTSDPFALDAANGRTTPLPVGAHLGQRRASPAGGLLGLGFTGLMSNGTSGYAALFDPAGMTAGGAAGRRDRRRGPATATRSAPRTPSGTASSTASTCPATSGPFVVHTRLPAPFAGVAASGGQSYGVFVGTGRPGRLRQAGGGGQRRGRRVPARERAGRCRDDGHRARDRRGRGRRVVDLLPARRSGRGDRPGRATRSTGRRRSRSARPQPVPATWFSGADRAGGRHHLDLDRAGRRRSPPRGTSSRSSPVRRRERRRRPGRVGAARVEVVPQRGCSVTNPSPLGRASRQRHDSHRRCRRSDRSAGTGGDTLGKGFAVDSNPGVGTVGHSFTTSHDGGYDVLNATFTDFGAGKTFTFSTDIDPTSIKGAAPPGPNEAGSVSGLELTGAAVTVTYEDGTSETGRLFRVPGSSGQAQVSLDGVGRAKPTVEVVGTLDTPATVTDPAQTIRVSGPSGASVRLLAVRRRCSRRACRTAASTSTRSRRTA